MGGFLDAAFGFPAVIFTVLLVPVVLYWLVVLAGAVDIDLLGDVGAEAGGADAAAFDVADGADGGDGGGLLAGWWAALGLAGVPVTVTASLVVVLGWLVALVATAAAADLRGAAAAVAGLAAIAAALVGGSLGAAVVGRPVARLFATTEAEARTAFVGRTCTVRTSTVTATFGQAEASDPSGATVLVQVRLPSVGETAGARSPLARGDRALIFDYDPAAEVFLVSPVDDALGAGADGSS